MEIGGELLGESRGLAALREQARGLLQRAASGRLPPILIEGETGTGKGLLARTLHRGGPRASRPFVDVNCAAIPESLLESELFGHEKGAFTDARQAKAGLFQAAHGGTLFLDEVGLLPVALQSKLLKALEDRAVRRLGSTRSEPVDAWIIAATSEDLREALGRGSLREDLYHRLAVVTLRLPPLRDRREDIPLLAAHFLARAGTEYGRPPKTLARDAHEALRAYAWPGNVRELSNAMERVTLLAEGTLVTAATLALPEPRVVAGESTPAERAPLKEAVWSLEHQRLVEALDQEGGNLTRAAARLGIPRNTLRYRLQRHELKPEPHAAPRRPAAVHPCAPGPEARPPIVEDGPAPAVFAPSLVAGIRWERRHLTFLGAELMSTADVDPPPEAGRGLEAMIDKVQGFGGRIEDLTPTSLVAAFGIEPTEEPARLAALAAMAIAKAVERAGRADPGQGVGARLALHVQAATVGWVGASLTIDGVSKATASAALQGLLRNAQAQDILVGPAAVPFLERRFELESGPPGSGASRLSGHERVGLPVGGRVAPLVGRQQERDLLSNRLDVARQGRGQVVGVVGEAGIGKSRLVSEFRRGLFGAAVLCLEAHCLSQASSIPYFPLRGLLRLIFGLGETDDASSVVEKLGAGVRALGLDAEAVVPWLLHLLSGVSDGIPAELSPEAVQARTFEVLRHIALQASRQTPLLLVVEDAHWIDRASEDFLATLAESIATERVLLLLTYRPGYRPAWIGTSSSTQVALPPLSPDEGLAVVRAVLRAEVAPEVAASILSRGEGNPFFLEELARAAGGAGISGAGTPPATLEAALSARIQALPEGGRRVLRTASVLGRHFSPRLLEMVASGPEPPEAQLRELKRLDLLQERVRLDEPSWSFKHALIQEAAYEGLPAAERQALHGAAARALRTLHAERPEEACELIAHHYLRGGDPDEALAYLELSNRKAARASAMAEAKGYFDEAMKLLDRRPDGPDARRRRVALLVDQVLVMFFLFRFDEYHELLKRYEAAALELPDVGLRGAFLARRGVCEWAVGEYDRAIVTFAAAAELCEAAGCTEDAGQAHAVRQWAHLYKGDYEAVLALLPSVARVLDRTSSPRWRAYALGAASRACTYRGRWEQAIGFAREEMELAERFADDALASHAALTLALAEGARGDLARAVAHGELALRKAPTPADKTWAHAILAWAWCLAGEPARGIEVLGPVVARSRAVSWRAGEFYAVWLGEAHLLIGDRAQARQALDECLSIAERHGMRYLVGSAHRLLGEAMRPDDAARAVAHFERSLVVLGEIGAENEKALAHAGYGRLLRDQGRVAEARRHLEGALETLERLGTLREPDRVRDDLARLEAS
jgi:transcriptional regulator with AAA-type ATPase domain/tetratricopeptide (TPR) repeat protein